MFEEVLLRHLRAIINKDFPLLETTLPDSGNLFLVFPTGKYSTTVEAYKEFHKHWFADPDWNVAHEVISVVEGQDFSVVNLMAHNTDKNSEGQAIAYDLVITLVFQKQNDRWCLISDQNTMLKDFSRI